jgi:hypothetical protein
MDFRIRENDGKGFFSLLIPCNSVANASLYLPSLTLPALISLLIIALVTLAYAGVHSCLAVNMDFRIRENDGKGFFSLLFRVIPCKSVANASSMACLLLFSVLIRGKCIFLACFPWQMHLFTHRR